MKILIIKTSSLGDIVQALPVISYIKKVDPSSEIDWIVERKAEELIRSHPNLISPLVIHTKEWKRGIFQRKCWREGRAFLRALRSKEYDVVFDLQGNVKSSLLLAFVKAKKKVGFAHPAEFPNRFFTQLKVALPEGQPIVLDYLSVVQTFFKKPQMAPIEPLSLLLSFDEEKQLEAILARIPDKFKVLLSPAAFWPNKEIDETTLVQMLKQLKREKRCFFLFASGSERERAIAKRLHTYFQRESIVLENLSIPLLQNLMAKMDLVCAMDSFPLHLAQTTPALSFGFFGPTLGSKYLLPSPKAGFFQGKCPLGARFEKRCSALRRCQGGECIKKITANELFSCLSHFLAKP